MSDPRKMLAYIKLGINLAHRYVSLFSIEKHHVPQFCKRYALRASKITWTIRKTPPGLLSLPRGTFTCPGHLSSFIEAFSGFLSGLYIEDEFLDAAESAGSPTPYAVF